MLILSFYILGAAVVILPFLLYRYPLCTDYLPHLAWMRVFLSPPESPMRRVFDIHFALIPNLGLPLFTVALGKLLPPATILNIYNLLGIIGVASGAIVLGRSISGRLYPTILLILPILHSSAVTYGLYGFVVGTALVLLILPLLQRKSFARKALILNLCAPVLFLIHLGALACMAFTVLMLEIEQQRPRWRAFLIAPLYFVSALPLYLLRTRPPVTHSLAFSNLPVKLIAISGIFDSGNMVVAAVCAVIGLIVVVFLYRSGVSIAPGWRVAVVGLWLAALAAPTLLEVSAIIDGRSFWYAALITVAAAQVPDSHAAFVGRLTVCAVALMLAIKVGFEIQGSAHYNRDIDEMAAAVEIIPPGSPVFVSIARAEDEAQCAGNLHFQESRFYWHIADLSAVAQRGLDTMMFVHRGVNVIEPKASFSEYFPAEPTVPPYAPLADYLFDHDDSSGLIKMIARGTMIASPGPDVLGYSLNWGRRYPYLIYINRGCAEDSFAAKLKLVTRGSFFKIYRNPAVTVSLF